MKNLKKLNYINFHTNLIKDLEPLKNLSNLKKIYLGDNKISNIEPIKDLDLHCLGLYNNSLTDIFHIYNMKNLYDLNIADNSLTGICEKYNIVEYLTHGWLNEYEIKELFKRLKTERRKRLINLLPL